jgi:hypothetical protein
MARNCRIADTTPIARQAMPPDRHSRTSPKVEQTRCDQSDHVDQERNKPRRAQDGIDFDSGIFPAKRQKVEQGEEDHNRREHKPHEITSEPANSAEYLIRYADIIRSLEPR